MVAASAEPLDSTSMPVCPDAGGPNGQGGSDTAGAPPLQKNKPPKSAAVWKALRPLTRPLARPVPAAPAEPHLAAAVLEDPGLLPTTPLASGRGEASPPASLPAPVVPRPQTPPVTQLLTQLPATSPAPPLNAASVSTSQLGSPERRTPPQLPPLALPPHTGAVQQRQSGQSHHAGGHRLGGAHAAIMAAMDHPPAPKAALCCCSCREDQHTVGMDARSAAITKALVEAEQRAGPGERAGYTYGPLVQPPIPCADSPRPLPPPLQP